MTPAVRRRRRVRCAALAVLLLAGTGCGADRVAAPDSTSAASAAPSAVASAAVADDPVRAIQEGAARTLAGTGRFSFRGSGPTTGTGTISLEGRFDGTRGTQAVEGTIGGEALAVLTTEKTVYLRKGADKWVDVGGSGAPPGELLGYLASDTSLTAGIISAKKVGPRAYEGVVDLARAGDAATRESRVAIGLLMLVAAEPDRAAFEAALDENGRLVRLAYTIVRSADQRYEYSRSYAGLGNPVTVTPPPADQVANPWAR